MPKHVKPSDMIGQRFGMLVVRCVDPFYDPKTDNGRKWYCVCDCGGSKSFSTTTLRDGRARSCGCMQPDHLKGPRKPKLRFRNGGLYFGKHKLTPEEERARHERLMRDL